MKVSWPWTEPEWKTYLFDEFRRCRDFPGWPTILSCHDEEDRAYFESLEELLQTGKLHVVPKDEKNSLNGAKQAIVEDEVYEEF